MTFASDERRRLSALFRELGPDQPTLCDGWSTRDLVVHLWLRENRPEAMAGKKLPPLSGYYARVNRQVSDRDFGTIVDDWESGPAVWSPVRLVDSVANAAEHFVHHEDVRRAQPGWQPRELDPEEKHKLHSLLRPMAKMLLRHSNLPVVLTPPALPPITAADSRKVAQRGDGVVRVYGEVGELVLWAFGREQVQVSIEGDANAIVRSSL